NVRVGLGSQASVAVGVVNDPVAGHSTVEGPGSVEITGGVVSTRWMVWLAVELLLQRSVAVQVRVTSWAWGQLPGVVTSLNVKVGLGSQLSLAVGVAKEGVAGHSMVEGPGNDEITGGVVSPMWTVAGALTRTGSTFAGQPRPGSKLPTAVAMLTWSPRHSTDAR